MNKLRGKYDTVCHIWILGLEWKIEATYDVTDNKVSVEACYLEMVMRTEEPLPSIRFDPSELDEEQFEHVHAVCVTAWAWGQREARDESGAL